MECKCVADSEERNSIWELIDTLWNVNEKAENEYWVEDIELIDTLWNVSINSLNPLYVYNYILNIYIP